MSLEQGIFEEIKLDSVLEAKIVRDDGTHRIYPLRAPDGEAPEAMLVYNEVVQSLTYPLVRSSLFQISCIADDFDTARGMADDIDRIFNDYSEGILGGVFGVKYIKFAGRTSLYDEQAKLYVFPVELFIKF